MSGAETPANLPARKPSDWTRGPARTLAGAMLLALTLGGLGLSLTHERVPGDAPVELAAADVAWVRIELNSATSADLQALPGIGPKRAAAILEDRQRRGPFQSIEDLDRVRGIGPRTVERMRPFLKVTPPAGSAH